MALQEDPAYTTSQILTYIGNKRSLITDIEKQITCIKNKLNVSKCVCADLFSGSGIVSRMMKKHASKLFVNDLEDYSQLINSCYLTNKSDFDDARYAFFYGRIHDSFADAYRPGLIAAHYAPKDEAHITKDDRVFYTRDNAVRIDTFRRLIDEQVTDDFYKKFFLAPLLVEASVHVNTGGVFKGFYKDKNTGIGCYGGTGKNALARICGTITLNKPVLSNFSSEVVLYRQDTAALAAALPHIDIAYLDPPYNQHPYGSNYFMLNVILKNKIEAPVSKISGITADWNRSDFNKPAAALHALETTVARLDASFIIISYNSDGFISFDEMKQMLQKYGIVSVVEIPYNTFRASRNLHNRDIHVSEYLFIVEK